MAKRGGRGGWDRGGWDRGDRGGWDRGGRVGWDHGGGGSGCNRCGWNRGGWDRSGWQGNATAAGAAASYWNATKAGAAASSSNATAAGAAARAAGATAPLRVPRPKPKAEGEPFGDAFSEFLDRADIQRLNFVKEWREEVKSQGKRHVSMWDSFKNYRRRSLNQMHKARFLSMWFQRWRFTTAAFQNKSTVRDLMWNEERWGLF